MMMNGRIKNSDDDSDEESSDEESSDEESSDEDTAEEIYQSGRRRKLLQNSPSWRVDVL